MPTIESETEPESFQRAICEAYQAAHPDLANLNQMNTTPIPGKFHPGMWLRTNRPHEPSASSSWPRGNRRDADSATRLYRHSREADLSCKDEC